MNTDTIKEGVALDRPEWEKEYLLEFQAVNVEIARLQERFWSLQNTLARRCPACYGSGWVSWHLPCPRPVAGWGCCCSGDCFTCGGSGRVLPHFHDGEGLVYLDSHNNIIEFDSDGNDKEWPESLAHAGFHKPWEVDNDEHD
jgi:hypothetical protein